MFRLDNQTALVTGASRGIGRAICVSLAQAGARVVAAARDEKSLAETVAAARQAEARGEVLARTLDVCSRAAVDAAVEEVVGQLGRLDILVNNAGVTRDGLLLNMDDEQFETVLTTNLRAVFWLTRAVSKHMVRARKGRIINISSVSGVMGNAGQANYAASKAGVIGLSKSVAKELARRGITCNVVAPGFVTTDMTANLSEEIKNTYQALIPVRRFGQPEDVAAVVTFLASAEASYVTGQVILVDGGLHM